MLFLARWARRLSWKETAEAFRTSCEKVFNAVEYVVTFGLEHRVPGQSDPIGVDEIQYAKGHKYPTLVYQIDLGVTPLLWVGHERTIESFQGFFKVTCDELASKIVFVLLHRGQSQQRRQTLPSHRIGPPGHETPPGGVFQSPPILSKPAAPTLFNGTTPCRKNCFASFPQ
jgi:hypothetical protein